MRPDLIQIERAIGCAEAYFSDAEPLFLQDFPRGEVRIVVEPRDHDLVLRGELLSERAAQPECEGRHVRPEDDLPFRAAEQVRGGAVCLRHNAVALTAGTEGTVQICIGASKVAGDSLDYPARHLRAAGGRPNRPPDGVRRGGPGPGTGHVPRPCRWTVPCCWRGSQALVGFCGLRIV